MKCSRRTDLRAVLREQQQTDEICPTDCCPAASASSHRQEARRPELFVLAVTRRGGQRSRIGQTGGKSVGRLGRSDRPPRQPLSIIGLDHWG